jgi:hypothetical protein
MLMHPLTEINTSVEVLLRQRAEFNFGRVRRFFVGAVTRVYKSCTALRVAPPPLHIIVFDNNLNHLGAKALPMVRHR